MINYDKVLTSHVSKEYLVTWKTHHMTLKAGHKSVCLQCARFFSFIWMRVVVREGKHILKDKKGIPYNVNSSYSGWYIMGEFCFSLNSMYFSNLLQWTCLIEWFLTSFSFLRQRDTSWGSYRDSEQVGSGLCGPVGLSPLLSIAAVLIHTTSPVPCYNYLLFFLIQNLPPIHLPH